MNGLSPARTTFDALDIDLSKGLISNDAWRACLIVTRLAAYLLTKDDRELYDMMAERPVAPGTYRDTLEEMQQTNVMLSAAVEMLDSMEARFDVMFARLERDGGAS